MIKIIKLTLLTYLENAHSAIISNLKGEYEKVMKEYNNLMEPNKEILAKEGMLEAILGIEKDILKLSKKKWG